MKNAILLLLSVCLACAKPDLEDEQKKITQLIDDETNFAASKDSLSWSTCWINTDEAQLTIAAADDAQHYNGWNAIRTAILRSGEPFELKLERVNYNFVIDNKVAFVSFDQSDNWGGEDGRKTTESRTLRKVDGEWKIVSVNVVALSTYEKRKGPSYHVTKEKISLHSETGMRNQSGLGGMAVGYVEVPGGTDFGPLFSGLPQNMCPAPHWGYVFEGKLRIKYADGKEEVVNSGEVFYMPAPHTGVVEEDAKFIDFSPEAEFNQLMDHFATIMQAQSGE